jgi:hypothetical protein
MCTVFKWGSGGLPSGEVRMLGWLGSMNLTDLEWVIRYFEILFLGFI